MNPFEGAPEDPESGALRLREIRRDWGRTHPALDDPERVAVSCAARRLANVAGADAGFLPVIEGAIIQALAACKEQLSKDHAKDLATTRRSERAIVRRAVLQALDKLGCMRPFIVLLALLTASCACVPPDGPNHRERFRARWDAVVATYEAHGHDFRGTPFECLHVTVRRPDTFMCGGVRAVGCYTSSWPSCPQVEISASALRTAALEHELLHFLLDAHGIDSLDHAGDFPDFFRVAHRAYEKTHP